jgi:SWI/SNF-related matrix-associated actin-dependent regulator of chromatin subfamily A containing DEAD/H box 1
MDEKLEYIIEDLSVMSDFEIHTLCSRFKKVNKHALSPSAWMNSGKVNVLKRIVPEMKQKVLEFYTGR